MFQSEAAEAEFRKAREPTDQFVRERQKSELIYFAADRTILLESGQGYRNLADLAVGFVVQAAGSRFVAAVGRKVRDFQRREFESGLVERRKDLRFAAEWFQTLESPAVRKEVPTIAVHSRRVLLEFVDGVQAGLDCRMAGSGCRTSLIYNFY